MSDKKSKRPIDDIRDSAGSIEIGTDDDSSPIIGLVSCADRLLVVKRGGVYEVLLADQIDPKRTNPRIPNSQRRLIPYGSDSEFISRSLLTANILVNETYLRKGVSRDRIMPIVLALTTKLAQLNDMVQDYTARECGAVEALGSANKKLISGGTFQIPEVPNIDSLCKSFFTQTKHALQDLLAIAEGFFGGELKPGFFSNLEKLASEKFGDADEFYVYLTGTVAFRKFVRDVRNCIEHEKPTKRVIFSNLRINEAAEIVLPTFELIHPEHPQEEIRIKLLVESTFSNLVEFTESLIAHMVAKNIDKTKKGLSFDLMYFPEGNPQNPNIRYGFGVMLEGSLRPIG